ncbi:MAG: hypothetical protein QNK03_20415 [Myxococcota bacterium]|nr:hypothetical protein [Myxococcota bacterium]
MRLRLPFWQRLLITIGVMLLMSFLAGVLWQRLFGASIPSYLAGAVGGLSALPTWDLLTKIRSAQKERASGSSV